MHNNHELPPVSTTAVDLMQNSVTICKFRSIATTGADGTNDDRANMGRRNVWPRPWHNLRATRQTERRTNDSSQRRSASGWATASGSLVTNANT